MTELTDWLRSTIKDDLDAAKDLEAASWRVASWAREHPDGGGDERIALVDDSEHRKLIVFTWPGAHVTEDELEHMARHDPRDTIARCQAELAELDELAALPHYAWDDRPEYGCPMFAPDLFVDPACSCGRDAFVDRMTRTKANGYRHRPGWQEGWVS